MDFRCFDAQKTDSTHSRTMVPFGSGPFWSWIRVWIWGRIRVQIWDPNSGSWIQTQIWDRQNAGQMTSKRRFLHFRPIMENLGLNVNLKWFPWIRQGSRRDPRPFKVFHPNRPFYSLKWVERSPPWGTGIPFQLGSLSTLFRKSKPGLSVRAG